MGVELHDLLGQLYADHDGSHLTTGCFCLAPVFHPHRIVNVVRPVSDDPAHPDNKKYQIVPLHPSAVGAEGDTVAGRKFPDKTLNLGLGEDLFVVPGKRRPVVILFNPQAALESVTRDGGKSEKEMARCFGCAPSYSLTDQHGNPRHRAMFIENCRALSYSPCCYLPYHQAFRDRECFLRMDRICWLPDALLHPLNVKLTRNGLDYALAWYEWFCGKPLQEELLTAQQLLLEEVAERRAAIDTRESK
jgi:hypothetical protein